MKKRIFSSQLAEAIAQPGWVGAGPAGISYRQMAVDESDSEDKGYVLWKSWQETYLGMVDSRYLAELTIDKCVKIAQKRPENTIVALDQQDADRAGPSQIEGRFRSNRMGAGGS